ncbi:uncharacterized protein BDV14DRAFT_173482 [Aspergillus stella-maris]|uniref:uncharacterized protein n=1 Tax=Aspergillus stella-maris TaxID=1810926 RepID=UPI003CCD72B2
MLTKSYARKYDYETLGRPSLELLIVGNGKVCSAARSIRYNDQGSVHKARTSIMSCRRSPTIIPFPRRNELSFFGVLEVIYSCSEKVAKIRPGQSGCTLTRGKGAEGGRHGRVLPRYNLKNQYSVSCNSFSSQEPSTRGSYCSSPTYSQTSGGRDYLIRDRPSQDLEHEDDVMKVADTSGEKPHQSFV